MAFSAHPTEGTLKEFTKKRNPFAPKCSESPFGDFPADWSRPTPKGRRNQSTSAARSLSPQLGSPQSTSKVDPLPSINRRTVGGGDGSFADGASGPPRAGAFQARHIPPTKFRLFYERGDLPISISHRPNGNKLDWKRDKASLDYHHYLPIFFDGLREVEEPYHFLALQGCFDLLAAGGDKILPCVAQLITPIKTALHTRVPDVIRTVLLVLQRLVTSSPHVGQALVPYYQQILLVVAMFKGRTKNIRDGIDYGQRKRDDLGELIEETVQLLELHGGPDAFANIRYVMPTYQSCQIAAVMPPNAM